MIRWITTRCGRMLSGLFLFQAEDGIRDLVRSRGLGDVYKRQRLYKDGEHVLFNHDTGVVMPDRPNDNYRLNGVIAVSYTHLTLPTSDLV